MNIFPSGIQMALLSDPMGAMLEPPLLMDPSTPYNENNSKPTICFP